MARPRRLPRVAHIRALLWLRWRVTVRSYTLSRQRRVGLALLLLCLLGMGGGGALVTGIAYVSLPGAEAAHLLIAVLTLGWLLWLLLPLFQYTVNEGLDITRLQTYPLTRGERMAGLLLATCLDVSTLGLLLLYIPILIDWHASAISGAVTVAALALAYVHTVTLSQLALAALMGLLRSRRYRDLALLASAALAVAITVLAQVLLASFRHVSARAILDAPIDRYLQWTPPGMAARAISMAATGQYRSALVWLAALSLLAVALVVLWSRMLDHTLMSAETGRVRHRRLRWLPPQRPAHRGGTTYEPHAIWGWRLGWPFHILPGPARAIAVKDARYLWRDPQLKAALLSALFPLIILFLPRLYAQTQTSAPLASPSGIGPIQVLLAPLPALFIVLTLALNALGLERQALRTLFLFPVRPLDVVLGKNVLTGSVAFAAAALVTLVAAALGNGWVYVPLALAGGLAAILVMLGCGNLTSVVLPFRVGQTQAGAGSVASDAGCLRSVVMLLVLVVTLFLLLPVAIAIGMPLVKHETPLFLLVLPVALIYGVAVYLAATHIAVRQLRSRWPDILDHTARD